MSTNQTTEQTSEQPADQVIEQGAVVDTGDVHTPEIITADEPTPLIAGHRGYRLPEPVTVAGIQWTDDDGDPHTGSPIGAALAAEMASAS